MRVPTEQVRSSRENGGKESDELVLADIAYVVSEMEEHETYIMGSGSTVAAVMAEMKQKTPCWGWMWSKIKS